MYVMVVIDPSGNQLFCTNLLWVFFVWFTQSLFTSYFSVNVNMWHCTNQIIATAQVCQPFLL